MPSVLVVDDDPDMLKYTQVLLETEQYEVSTASTGIEALQFVRQGNRPDIVLLDVMMPGLDGLETLERLREAVPEIKVIMLSCLTDTHKVVQAMRLGALDYLAKPLDEVELADTLKRCIESGTAEEQRELVEELGGGSFFLTASQSMRTIREHIGSIAGVNVPVLLLGESGTGKEVIALMIHKLSSRSHRKFLKVNCAAIPEDLLESELFGYEAGAFTGANTSKPGKFELCDHGTILLDEIGEMPTRLQAKLLQVLQEQKYFRLGSRAPVSVDVRILAATNVNVEQAIKEGKLRLDLYYRLNAFSVSLPPLRERKEEVAPLLRHHMTRLAQMYKRAPLPISERLLRACMQHSWPGNVRELHNFAKRYLVLGNEDAMIAELRANNSSADQMVLMARANGNGNDLKKMVRNIKGEAEAEAIARALEQTNWNRKAAAELLNISYKALVYKSRQYGILPARFPAVGETGREADHPAGGRRARAAAGFSSPN
jgi:DNA-binding NtrC family response regulator